MHGAAAGQRGAHSGMRDATYHATDFTGNCRDTFGAPMAKHSRCVEPRCISPPRVSHMHSYTHMCTRKLPLMRTKKRVRTKCYKQ
eukprot:2672592-Pyramimonas_sp.AAC.1